MITQEMNQAIIAEFNGENHVHLAFKYKVSIQHIFQVLLNQQISNALGLLHLNEGSGQQALWAGKATQLESLFGLRAALLALQTATTLDSSNRGLVVIAYLPEVPIKASAGHSQTMLQVGLAKSPLSSQSHDYIESDQQAHSQPDAIKNPDISS